MFLKSKLQIYLDVFQQLNLDIFYFSHISSHSIIYYLRNYKIYTKNIGYIIVKKREMEIYNFFNSVKESPKHLVGSRKLLIDVTGKNWPILSFFYSEADWLAC